MNTPKIRFKGFKDDWEQRKVSDLLQERNEQAPRSEEYPLMAFIADQGVAPKGERYDRSALVNDENGKKYKRTEYGDFIYSSNNLETGSIGLNKYGNASISPVYSIFKRTSNVDLDFLGRRFLRKDFINEMVKWRQGVVYGQWKIHESDFLKINVVVPSIEEQKRIGHCFEKLDHLITLHQRKCDETKQLKKFMLQKMFPKNGEKNPEIRFEGFTDAWEQRKFEDVGTVAMCKRIFKEQTSEEGEVPFYKIGTFGGIPDAYITRELFEEYKKNYQYPNKGDILISASGSIGRTVEYTGKDEYYQDSNIVWLKHENDLDNSFLKVLYGVIEWSCEGSTIKRLYNDNFLKTEFMLPKIEEQIKIGEYFSKLDHLITLHQRKCEKLKALKKFMLQNMFI